jgi:hypothetical protein
MIHCLSSPKKSLPLDVKKQIMNQYNTQLPEVILKEYGRNIEKLVEYIVKIEDYDKRTRFAHTLVELMRQIVPNNKDVQEHQTKLWDDLFIMSKFRLEIDSPFQMPEQNSRGIKPKKVDYNQNRITYKHYGWNIELLIKKAFATEEPEEKFSAFVHLGRLMKGFYATWNTKDALQDETLLQHIESIAKQKIDPEIRAKLLENNVLEATFKERKTKVSNHNNPSSSNNNNNNNNNKKRRKK